MVMTILIFILFLAPLIFFHELGHFFFAKYYGVRVETFSIGFGPKILKFQWGETSYAISLFPLGGYVKMYGDNILEREQVPESERQRAFTHKSKWQRFWILFGGPLANFILAFVLFWALLVSGEKVPEPRVGGLFSDSKLYQYGLRTGDILSRVNGYPISSIFDFATLDTSQIDSLTVLRGGRPLRLEVPLSKEEILQQLSTLPPALRAPLVVDRYHQVWGVALKREEGGEFKVDENRPLSQIAHEHLGEIYLVKVKSFSADHRSFDYTTLRPLSVARGVDDFLPSLLAQNYWPVDLMVKGITKDSAAQAVGIRTHDILVGLEGQPLSHFQQLADQVSQVPEGASVALQLYRKGNLLNLEVTPRSKEINGQMRKVIGVYTSMVFSRPKMVQTPARGILPAVPLALTQTWKMTMATLKGFMHLVTGKVSLKAVGGPIAIAGVAKESFNIGLTYFFKIMAAISINLAVINLFPIPVLDGGHILFLIIETINGRPVSKRVVEASLKFGISVLFLLIFMSLYNDIMRFMSP